MSEELMGRARGRTRRRCRMLTANGSKPTHPGESSSQQQQKPKDTQVGEPVREQMGAMSLAAQEEQSASSLSRAVDLGTGCDQPQLRTRPASLLSKRGTSGTLVSLKANYFILESHSDWTLHQYKVDFAPDEDLTRRRKGLLLNHKDILGPYMFDGTLLFTLMRLDPDPLVLHSVRKADDIKIKITITRTKDLVMGDPNYVEFFNLVLRKCIASLNLQQIGGNYFDIAGKIVLEKFNLELWPGFMTSIRQHERDIMLGIDVTNKIIRTDTALDLLIDISQGSENWEERFAQAIVGASVLTPYNNRIYRVDDVDFGSSPLSFFKQGNKRVTFIEYYCTRYSLKISNIRQPLLISHPKKSDLLEGHSNNVVLIPELCCLIGVSEEMRYNVQLMKHLEKFTKIRPSAMMNKITAFMNRLTTNQQVKEEFSLWNMKFDPDLVKFEGRILVPEKIHHGGGKTSDGKQCAEWTNNVLRNPMYQSSEFRNWSIVYLQRDHSAVRLFVETLKNSSSLLQFKIPPPDYVGIVDCLAGTYVQAIEEIMSTRSPQLIMCIVPNKNAQRYSAIKKKCCVDRAVPSQVVLTKHLTGRNLVSIATKICIQVNCKMGGSPWSIRIPFSKPVMVVGIDLCQDSSAKTRCFGAMVASLDTAYSKYYSGVSPHKSGEDLSNDLSAQLVKAVLVYRKCNGFLPQKIIIYRDGIGEGTERYVLNHEVEKIRASLQEIYQPELLQMAFIIVTKRVETRIFLNGNNAPPGTVADDVITNPLKYDFFLVSQHVREGTATPTSYNVIYDTSNLSPDILHKLTYKLCHLYYNWSGSVRVPAPVQYARKLALLCGQYLHCAPNEELNQQLYFL
ncbi:piwi-like protein Siwi [Rhodnius prolixus]